MLLVVISSGKQLCNTSHSAHCHRRKPDTTFRPDLDDKRLSSELSATRSIHYDHDYWQLDAGRLTVNLEEYAATDVGRANLRVPNSDTREADQEELRHYMARWRHAYPASRAQSLGPWALKGHLSTVRHRPTRPASARPGVVVDWQGKRTYVNMGLTHCMEQDFN